MSVNHLNLRDLSYICAVAHHLNFGQAAASCAVSQPAISSRIQHIEDSLGVVLFERSKRKVLVTDKGLEIVEHARSILGIANQIDSLIAESKDPLSGKLRLGVIATLGPYLMPLLLKPLHKQYPQLELQLTEGLTEDLIQKLNEGSLDMVLAARPIDFDSIACLDLFFEPFVLAAPKNHAITKNAVISAALLDSSEMLLLEEGHCLSGQSLAVCPSRKQGGATTLQSASLETLRHMIASGSKYSLLPALSVGKNPSLKSLIEYREFDGKKVGRTLCLCTRKAARRPKDVFAFSALIRNSIPDLFG